MRTDAIQTSAATALSGILGGNPSPRPLFGGEVGTVRGVEIFSVGTWRGSKTVTADKKYVGEMLRSFNELNTQVSGFGIPVKLGHNRNVGEPAYGWVTALSVKNGKVVADFSDVPSELIDAMKRRQYNNVSVEIYDEVNYDGKTFKNVLSGVALLGAEWPAVKGLKPVSASMFAEAGSEAIELTEKVTVETVALSEHQALEAKFDAQGVELTEAKAALAEANAALDAARSEAASKLAAEEDAAIDALVEGAVASGKILPAKREAVKAFASSLKGVKLSVGGVEKSAVTAVAEFIASVGEKVDFTETGGSDTDAPGSQEKAADVVTSKAKALMAADAKLSFKDAAAKVFEADPALRERYAKGE